MASTLTPLCLPYELMHGHWSRAPHIRPALPPHGVVPSRIWRGSLRQNATWEPLSSCLFYNGTPIATRALLQEQNASFVLSGNSVMRHLFFRLGAWLDGLTTYSYDMAAREAEKKICSKEPSPKVGAGEYRKPYCKKGCCGLCSCLHTSGNVTIYFVWQQEWFDDNIHRTWQRLFLLPDLRDRRPYFLFNAGLVRSAVREHAVKAIASCIPAYQYPRLRQYLVEELPSNVLPIYLASPPEQQEGVDMFLAAQDGMLRALFAGIPSTRRPVWLDAREMAGNWVDYIDSHHFGGATAGALVRMILHLAVHWKELYAVDNRGWLYERDATKKLLKHDSNGPSNAAALQMIELELNASVSPPPAMSKRYDCY